MLVKIFELFNLQVFEVIEEDELYILARDWKQGIKAQWFEYGEDEEINVCIYNEGWIDWEGVFHPV
jgi:hypothetical protein